MNTVQMEACGYKFQVLTPEAANCRHYSHNSFVEHEPPFGIWCHGIRKGDVVLDIGACFGEYTMPALAAGARVIAYEPWNDGRRLLELNAQANGFQDRLTVRSVALWDDAPPAEDLFKEVWGHHYPVDGVKTVKLDDDLASLGVDHVDWMKFDIEGAELHALRGAQKALASRPGLIIEDHDDTSGNQVGQYPKSIDSSRKIQEMLKGMGYNLEMMPWACNRKYIVARFSRD